MSRIIYPEDFLNQILLLSKVNDKHVADGPASPIINFLAQQNIIMATDMADSNTAQTKNAAANLLHRQSENFRQLRDLKFDPVFKRLKDEIQFLKKFLSPNTSALGDWGVTVDGENRIKYPVEFLEQLELFTNFKEKHDTFAAGTSPLEQYLVQHNIDLDDDETATADALALHNQFLQAAEDAEDATEDRDNKWNPVMKHIRLIGGFLKKLYNDNTKQLGDWGFTVDDSKRPPKYRTSKVKPADQITVNGIIIGGTLTNLSPVDLHVYKGKTTTGTPAIVPPNQMLGMNQGSSVITVVNPNTLVHGKFKVLSSY